MCCCWINSLYALSPWLYNQTDASRNNIKDAVRRKANHPLKCLRFCVQLEFADWLMRLEQFQIVRVFCLTLRSEKGIFKRSSKWNHWERIEHNMEENLILTKRQTDWTDKVMISKSVGRAQQMEMERRIPYDWEALFPELVVMTLMWDRWVEPSVWRASGLERWCLLD